MSEINLENKIESDEAKSHNNSLNQIQEHLEGLKTKDDEHDKLFFIVCEALKEEGLDLPNEKMEDIREMNIGDDHFIVLRFKDCVSMSCNKNQEASLAKIKGDQYVMEGEEVRSYREKYYNYLAAFLIMQNKIIDGKSRLAKTRLEKLGI